MKRKDNQQDIGILHVSEMGLSPRPWKVLAAGIPKCVGDGSGGIIATIKNLSDKDARMMAAAPKLYECLREAVYEMCHLTCETTCKGCNMTEKGCFVVKWRNALAKAGGGSGRERKWLKTG